MLKDITCNSCESKFNIWSLTEDEVEVAEGEKEVREVYFNCPFCLERYHVEFVNEEVERLKDKLNESRLKHIEAKRLVSQNPTTQRQRSVKVLERTGKKLKKALRKESDRLDRLYKEETK